jgi:hypothetical protein
MVASVIFDAASAPEQADNSPTASRRQINLFNIFPSFRIKNPTECHWALFGRIIIHAPLTGINAMAASVNETSSLYHNCPV